MIIVISMVLLGDFRPVQHTVFVIFLNQTRTTYEYVDRNEPLFLSYDHGLIFSCPRVYFYRIGVEELHCQLIETFMLHLDYSNTSTHSKGNGFDTYDYLLHILVQNVLSKVSYFSFMFLALHAYLLIIKSVVSWFSISR